MASRVRNCTLFPDDPHLCDVIIRVPKAMGSLSFVGSIFMMAVIWLFKKHQIFAQRLVLYLSIAAFMDSIVFLLPEFIPDGPFCDFQGFFLTYCHWSVLLWACCITFDFYLTAIRAVETEKYEIWYHVVSWGVPVIFASLPFIGDHYGAAGVWCWIDDESSEWRFGIWYGPLWILLAAMLFAYVYISWKLRRKAARYVGTFRAKDERQREMLKNDIRLLRAYPVVYMALAIFPSVNRIQNAVASQKVFWLFLMHVMTAPLHGAVYVLVFLVFDRATLRLLTWSSIKDALFQRTHPSTPGLTERTFTQTYGGGLAVAANDGTENSSGKEEDDTSKVCTGSCHWKAEKIEPETGIKTPSSDRVETSTVNPYNRTYVDESVAVEQEVT